MLAVMWCGGFQAERLRAQNDLLSQHVRNWERARGTPPQDRGWERRERAWERERARERKRERYKDMERGNAGECPHGHRDGVIPTPWGSPGIEKGRGDWWCPEHKMQFGDRGPEGGHNGQS